MMTAFEELIASRKQWIEQTLKPWCRKAPLGDLKNAEQEWGDIAGRVDPKATLWIWAWSRFPELVHEGLNGLDETHPVRVVLQDGTEIDGFPDNRNSTAGRLVVLRTEMRTEKNESPAAEESGPYTIDDIVSVTRVPAEQPDL